MARQCQNEKRPPGLPVAGDAVPGLQPSLDEHSPAGDDVGGGTALEYTDAPATESTEQPFTAATPATGLLETAEGQASDLVAVILSIVPGLGHIYKGYRLIGMFLIFLGTPMSVGLALLIATGTAGFGFFLLPIYWIATMVHVWGIPDRVVTAPEDEGEQY
ncbi:hypothetical protein BH20VER3_BH20VER3_24020 [soil metagenome]